MSHNSLFLRACRCEPTERTPIWLMRQAGRYMQNYREIRSKVSFLDLCKDPALAAEIMIDTVEQIGVDAAIIFSDLLPILQPMGFDLEFLPGEGPKIHNPISKPENVEKVQSLKTMEELSFVPETVRLTKAGLPSEIPVIGFAGAPFTLAGYTIEGGGSRDFRKTKSFMYNQPHIWGELLEKIAVSVALYLNAQAEAGADALQIFDSWVGCLSVADYEEYVAPYYKTLFDNLPKDMPIIHFGTGNPALLASQAAVGGSVLGVDWRISLPEAKKAVGDGKALQGNLDPMILLADKRVIRQQAKRVLDEAAGLPGHIFNLGHGILPQTPPSNVKYLVETVKELSSK